MSLAPLKTLPGTNTDPWRGSKDDSVNSTTAWKLFPLKEELVFDDGMEYGCNGCIVSEGIAVGFGYLFNSGKVEDVILTKFECAT